MESLSKREMKGKKVKKEEKKKKKKKVNYFLCQLIRTPVTLQSRLLLEMRI